MKFCFCFLKKLKNTKNKKKKKLAVVDKFAKPEDKTLDNLKKHVEEQKGYTTKIVPKIVRRNSFSAEFL